MYRWVFKDTKFTKDRGTVFSCFACGGGSTMGYKLAGFDVIGFNEIDPRMAETYKKNHNPKYTYVEPIQTFKARKDLPKELYNLDILDGSPPCSSFSMSGNREKDWGKEKKFKEGQALQILDDLFFHFIDLADKLQPKMVIAENVKGLLQGNAIKYVHDIYRRFKKAGYHCEHTLLDASKMGVPQRRERVFFIAIRNDIANPFLKKDGFLKMRLNINLDFNMKRIPFKEVYTKSDTPKLTEHQLKLWKQRLLSDRGFGDIRLRIDNKKNHFSYKFIKHNETPCTLTTHNTYVLYNIPRLLNNTEIGLISTFPTDYNYNNNQPIYICGMSVPPLMVYHIAKEIYIKVLSKLK